MRIYRRLGGAKYCTYFKDFQRKNFGEDDGVLIEAKVKGQEITAPAPIETPPVINLMDALRQSLTQATQEKPTKKMTSSAKPKAAKRKKSP